MKIFKLILLCTILFTAFSLQAENYSYKKGDIVGEAAFKTSFPMLGTWLGEVMVSNDTTGVEHDAKLGDLSTGIDLRVLYFLSARTAVGVHVGGEMFDPDLASGLDEFFSTGIANYMFTARYYFNPQDKFKFYIPFSIGIASTKIEIEMAQKEEFSDVGFALNTGVGFDYFMKDNWGLGFELRYNHNTFDDTETTSEGYSVHLYPRTNYFSSSFRVFTKF